MFIIDANPTFSAPVSFNLPGDNGVPVVQSFTATFNRLSQSKIDTMLADPTTKDVAMATALLSGWTGIQAAGADLPFTPDNLNLVLDVQGAATAIVSSYFQAYKDASAKN